MNDVALVANQVAYEQRAYWRNPASAFFTFAFPLVFFVILAGLLGSQKDTKDLGVGVKLAQYYTPSILGYAIMSCCFLSIALTIVRQRESGILKRYRGSPLPSWAFVGGVIGSCVIVAVILSTIVLLFGHFVYSVHLSAGRILPVAVTIIVAALSFCALGIAVSSFIPNLDAGPAIINLPYFVLVFISGTYFPVSGGLAKVANFFPLRPFIQALYRSFNPYNVGSAWGGHELRTVAIWGIAGTIVAVRRFKWMPRR